MTAEDLRDRFAGLAMQAILMTDAVPGPAHKATMEAAKAGGRGLVEQITLDAYEVADQMMVARNAPAFAPVVTDAASAMQLMKAAPNMAKALADLDLLLANAGHAADHPWRRLVRSALGEAKAIAA